MPLFINTNIPALSARSHLNKAQHALHQSFSRLSSGYRIVTAADDAAGMAVSESMRAQIRSFAVAERNANNGISMTSTAEGGMGEISSMLIRLRELSVQASNGDLTSNDRGYLDVEYQALISEIDRVALTTEFNQTELLGGATTTVSFQVGINTQPEDKIDVVFGGMSSSALTLGGTGVTGGTAVNAQTAIDQIDIALQNLSSRRAEIGAATNRLNVAVSNSQTMRTNIEAANSRIRDVDVAEETSRMARNQVLLQAATAVLAQANQAPQLALQLLQ